MEGSKQIIENLDPDLELTKPNVGSELSVYESILQPQTIFGKQCIKPFATHYTTNVEYLQDTQKLCNTIQSIPLDKHLIESTWNNFSEIKNNNTF